MENNQPLDPDELLTTDEVAARLKIQPQTVLLYLKHDKMPYVKIGGHYRVYRKDLDAFLAQNYKQPGKK